MFPPILKMLQPAAGRRGSRAAASAGSLATFVAIILCFGLSAGTSVAQPTSPTLVVGTPGLTVDYYSGYFHDSLSFFTTHTPAIRNRPLEQLNFAEAETDNFGVGGIATYYSPGNPDEFSGRFGGQLYVLTAGTYTFYLQSDDAAYVWLDNGAQPVAFHQGDNLPFQEKTGSCLLTAGLHTLRVDYGEHGGSQGLILQYSGPAMPKQLIPNGVLYSQSAGRISPTLSYFEAAARGQQVDLSWQTTTEEHSVAFVVQKSVDGVVFSDLLRQPCATGTPGAHGYETTDQQPVTGWNFYRMQQVRNDRPPVYSPIKAVEIKPVPFDISIYPVPNDGSFFVRIQPTNVGTASLELVDMIGRQQYRQQLQLSDGDTQRIKPDMATGLYMLRLTTSAGVFNQKISLGVLR